MAEGPTKNVVITPQMIEAGRLALIEWHEGAQDFRGGALGVLIAALRSGGYQPPEDEPGAQERFERGVANALKMPPKPHPKPSPEPGRKRGRPKHGE